jgi:signal transduction histidine kinase
VRIALDVPSPRLRRALEDLFLASGHVVARGDEVADLRLAVGGAGESAAGAVPVLRLARPGEARGDADLAAALSRARSGASPGLWEGPLDPEALLRALGGPEEKAATGPGRGRAAGTESVLATAPDPWLEVRVSDGALRWANVAARARLEAGAPAESFPDLPALLERVRSSPDGLRPSDLAALPGLLLWWSPGPDRRVVGVLRPPEGEGHLRALAELGRASALLAHELRNPLAGLVGAIDLLGEDAPPEERREVAGLARQRLGAMRALLDDTLRFARPIPGRPAPIDAAAVLRGAVRVARTDPAFRGVDLRVEGATDPCPALGNEEALHQALQNLLLNAAQALAGRGTVAASVERTGAWVVLRVRDDGPGLDREHAFTPFWTTKKAGTGLGLAFVRRVAEAAGGRALAESVSTGTSIRIDLPAPP